ncbi:MAG: 50S ribosomal protein L5 [Phycisphaerae bacterium]|nr:50S ribosomal protein L5 [Phycisphaerae bacterium]
MSEEQKEPKEARDAKPRDEGAAEAKSPEAKSADANAPEGKSREGKSHEGKPRKEGAGKEGAREGKDAGKKRGDGEGKAPREPQAPRAPHVPGKRAHPVPRLEQKFREEVMPAVMSEFKLENRHQVPKLAKIMVNTGVGKVLENQKLKPEYRDAVIDTYMKITGQKPVMVKARKSVANFKVREGAPSAFMVTLRRDRMWHFLDRLINLAIPRIKDFRGVNDKSFDKSGSWAFGLSEQAVWPEINMANVVHTHGMNINLVFDRSTPAMSRFVLDRLGMPFVRPEPSQQRRAEPAKA